MTELTESSSRPPTRPYRRRRKFIRRDLQLKIIFGSLFVAFLVLVFNFQIPIVGMWVMGETSQIPLGPVHKSLQKLLLASFGISFLLTMPLSLWMGVVFSFHFCGPIYRIKKFFQDMQEGPWDGVCNLRKTDDLQDVAEMINRFMSLSRERLRGQHELLCEVRSLLESGDLRVDDDKRRSLVELIEAEGREYQRRFASRGGDAGGSDAGGEEQEEEERLLLTGGVEEATTTRAAAAAAASEATAAEETAEDTGEEEEETSETGGGRAERVGAPSP